jgi:hypothetical protein
VSSLALSKSYRKLGSSESAVLVLALLACRPDARVRVRGAGTETFSAPEDMPGAAALGEGPPSQPDSSSRITIAATPPSEIAAMSFFRFSAPNFTKPSSDTSQI